MVETLLTILLNLAALLGASFTLIAALGLVRFPDFYCRTHAAAKAGAFGGALMVIAAGIALGNFKDWIVVLLVIAFFYVTTPVASHLLAKAAMHRKVFFYCKDHGPKASAPAPEKAE